MFGPFLSFLKAASPLYAYVLLFAGCYFEVLVPFDIFVPGEIFFYAGGLLSAAGYLSLWTTIAACVAGGYLGDISSFYIGKRYAARMERSLEGWRIFHEVYDDGKEFMDRHGDWAVFLSRFLGPTAKVTPFFAGASGMVLRHFLLLDLVPPLCTIPLHVGIGYGIGVGVSFLRAFAGDSAFLIYVPIVVFAFVLPVFLIYWQRRNRKKRTRTRHVR